MDEPLHLLLKGEQKTVIQKNNHNMKRVSLFLVCLLATVGVVRAGAPLTGYIVKKTKPATWHAFSANATTIGYLQDGDTIAVSGSQKAFSEYFRETILLGNESLLKINAGDSVKGSGVRPMGIVFPLDGAEYTHFGISGSGSVYFGTADGIVPGVYSRASRGSNGGSFIYNSFIRPTSKFTNMTDGRFEPATVRAIATTRIQYETVADTLYIGFENLSVINQNGEATLTASFQYRITSDGDMALVIDNFTPTADEDFTFRYAVQSRITKTSGIARSLYDWNGTLNDFNPGDLALGTGSDSLRNVEFKLMPPPPCEPITGLEIDVDGRMEIGVNSISFASSGFRWDREKAPNLLLVLSPQADALKNELADGTVYKDTNKIGGFPTRVSLSTGYIYPFTGLTENTTYYLHIFPFNATTCAGGPLYEQETIVPVTTTFAPPASISVTKVERTDLTVAVQSTDKYILAVSEQMLGGTYAAASVLKNGIAYTEGQLVEYGGHSFRIVAVGAEGSTVRVGQLRAGQDAYFYAWAMRGEGTDVRYSKNYAETVDKTIGTAPLYLDFNKYQSTASFLPPAGWHSSQGIRYPHFVINTGGERDSYFDDNVFSSDPVSIDGNAEVAGKAAYIWAVSPWMEGSGQLQALFNVAFFTANASSGTFSLYNTLKSSDSVVFQMQVSGSSDWKKIGCLDKNSDWKGGMGEVVTGAFKADTVFRIRAAFYQDTAGTSDVRLAIKSMEIEESRPCKYVKDITAPVDAMGYLSAKVSWKDGNAPGSNHFIVNYGPVAEEEKWKSATTRDLSMDLTNLEANTLYQAKIVAVCGEGDSSIVKSIKFTSKAEIPYNRSDWNVKKLEETGYSSLKGKAGSTLRPFDYDKDQSGWMLMEDDQDKSSVVGLYRSLASADNAWLATPVIYSKLPGRVKLSMELAAYLYDDSKKEKQAATGIGQTDTLYIYRSETGSATVFSEIVGRIALKDLQMEHTPFECEFSVKGGTPNVFAFYVSEIQDAGNVLNWSTLSMKSVDLVYEQIEYPAVTNLHTEGLGKTEVTVLWNGEAVEYALLYKKRKDEKYDTVYTENTRYELTGLASGTQYAYRVFGYYGQGHTLPGTLSAERYVNTLKECVPPTGLAVVGVSWQGATLTCQSENEKQVRFTAQNSEQYPNVYYLAGWRSTRDTMTFRGLFLDGFEFPYRAAVRAVCAPGDTSAWSETVDFTTAPLPPCGVPTNLASDYDAATRIATLTWKPGVNNDATWVFTRKEGTSRYDTAETMGNMYMLPNVEIGSVYFWKLRGLCGEYFVSDLTSENEIKPVANESVCTYAQALNIRVNGRQIVVENPENRLVKVLNVYDAMGQKIRTYTVNGTDNIFIQTDLHQGMVVIEAVGAGGEKTAVKAVVM